MEIRQELGVDASQALAGIDSFNRGVATMRANLNSIPASASRANKALAPIVAQLNAVSRAANAVPRTIQAPTISGGASGNFTSAAQQQSAAIQNAVAANQQLQTGLNNTGQAGANAAQRISIGFDSVARIIISRLVTQALGSLVRALSEAVEGSRELERSIAGIQTILPNDGFRGADQLSDQLKEISNSFNIPILEVSAGLYQTVSQQIGVTGTAAEQSAQQLEFLAASATLSKTGFGDLESTVGLLGGTLNAFQLGTEAANKTASQLFRTVELGKTTIPELASALGRVNPIAKQAGAGLDEVLGILASITNTGVKTSEAVTQLRGIFNAFIKPTKALQAALAEVGFSSSEAAIEQLGLVGAIQAVSDTTDGSNEALGKLFPRIRALSGVLSAVTQNADRTAENIGKIRDVSADLANEKLELVVETNAEIVTGVFNELSNELTTTFGDAVNNVLGTVLSFSDTLNSGVVDALGKFSLIAASVAAVALPAMAVSLAQTALAATGAATAVGALGTALTFAGPVAALAAAAAISVTLGAQLNELAAIRFDNLLDVGTINVDQISAGVQKEVELRKAANQQIIDSAEGLNRTLNRLTADQVADARQSAKAFSDAFVSATKKVISVSEQLAQDIRSQAQERTSQLASSAERQKSLEQQLADQIFANQTKRLTDEQKFAALQQRIAQEGRAAQQALSQAQTTGNADDIEDAVEAFERLADLSGDLQNLGDSIGGAQAARGAQIAIGVTRERIGLEQTLTQIIEDRQNREIEAAKQVEANNKELKTLLTEIATLSDVSAVADNPEAISKRIEEVGNLSQRVNEILRSNDSISADTFTNISGNVSQFVRDLNNSLSAAELSAAGNLQGNLQEQLEKALQIEATREAFVSVDLKVALASIGFDGNVSDIGRVLSEQIPQATQLFELRGELEIEEANLEQAKQRIQNALDLDTILTPTTTGFDLFFDQAALTARVKLAEGLKAGLEEGFSPERLSQLQAILQEFQNTNLDGGIESRIRSGALTGFNASEIATTVEELVKIQSAQNTIAQKQQQVNELVGQLPEQLQNATGLDALRAAIQNAETRASGLEGFIRSTGTTAQTTAQQINAIGTNAQSSADGGLQAMVNRASSLETSLARSASIAAGLGSSIPSGNGGGVSNNRLGGTPRFFNNGGFSPRNTDVVPAMLGRDEFVLNGRATRRNFSQAQAMNAGLNPVFRQEGGNVTNIGDINISVPEAEVRDGDRIARSLLKRITREKRKGNF